MLLSVSLVEVLILILDAARNASRADAVGQQLDGHGLTAARHAHGGRELFERAAATEMVQDGLPSVQSIACVV